MAWDTNAEGNITLSPLVDYQPAVLFETGCGLRLVLAHPEDQLGTGPIVVQMAMTVEQARALVEDLQKMIDMIQKAAPQGPPH